MGEGVSLEDLGKTYSNRGASTPSQSARRRQLEGVNLPPAVFSGSQINTSEELVAVYTADFPFGNGAVNSFLAGEVPAVSFLPEGFYADSGSRACVAEAIRRRNFSSDLLGDFPESLEALSPEEFDSLEDYLAAASIVFLRQLETEYPGRISIDASPFVIKHSNEIRLQINAKGQYLPVCDFNLEFNPSLHGLPPVEATIPLSLAQAISVLNSSTKEERERQIQSVFAYFDRRFKDNHSKNTVNDLMFFLGFIGCDFSSVTVNPEELQLRNTVTAYLKKHSVSSIFSILNLRFIKHLHPIDIYDFISRGVEPSSIKIDGKTFNVSTTDILLYINGITVYMMNPLHHIVSRAGGKLPLRRRKLPKGINDDTRRAGSTVVTQIGASTALIYVVPRKSRYTFAQVVTHSNGDFGYCNRPRQCLGCQIQDYCDRIPK